jgi:hypothetical protein
MVCRGGWCECVGCDEIHVKRKDREGESCSICLDGFEEDGEGDAKGALEWCKMGCGKNVHRECFESWRNECLKGKMEVRCTDCRTAWFDGCQC